MSNLSDLALAAQRYQRKRSVSPSGSTSASSYGSILSDSDPEASNEIYTESSSSVTQKLNKVAPQESYDGQHSRLDSRNKGMKLLLKMGWTEGMGLGLNNSGRKDPIPTPSQTPLLGLGKATQDAYMLSTSISKPKALESLVIARETEHDRIKREEKVKVVQVREEEREDRLRTFHCGICDKGYTTITQFEEHERSYAHHHARRALEAKQAHRVGKLPTEARLEKERKREAKELDRMARAAGVIVDSSFKPSTQSLVTSNISMSTNAVGSGGVSGRSMFKKIRDPSLPSSSIEPNPKVKSGWVTVDSKTVGSNQMTIGSAPIGFMPIAAPNVELDSEPSVPKATKPSFFTKSSTLADFSLAQEENSLAPLPKTTPPTDQKVIKSPPPLPVECPKPSKFAAVAARIAAQRAAGMISKPDKPKGVNVDTELEQMFGDGD